MQDSVRLVPNRRVDFLVKVILILQQLLLGLCLSPVSYLLVKVVIVKLDLPDESSVADTPEHGLEVPQNGVDNK